jgi:uncharacterized protein YheU (UPF0270 family)
MEIPHDKLSPETLRGVIENFVSREGTDYGTREWTLDEKIDQVLRQLKSGHAKIVFDEESETCTILPVP